MAKTSVNEILLLAQSAARRGDLDKARQLYQAILADFPGNARARQGLAGINRAQPAASARLDPPAEALDRLGALYNQGNLKALAAEATQLVNIYPQSAPLWNLIGLASVRMNTLPMAETAFRTAGELAPKFAEAHNNLGNVLNSLGRRDEAIQRYRRALEVNPAYAEAHNNLGNALKDSGDFVAAAASYRKATTIAPGYAGAHINLGNVLKRLGQGDAAIASLRRAVAIEPGNVATLNHLGRAFHDLGRFDEAAATYRGALAIDPDDAAAWDNLGNTLSTQGDFAAAEAAFRKALGIRPDFAECYRHLASIVKVRAGDPLIAAMQEVHANPGLTAEDRGHICFALAKALEDTGDIEGAFARLKEGNAARKRHLGYSIDQDRQLFAEILKAAPAIDKAAFSPKPAANRPVPIFVLGMPRSGTTLVEQIISCHSDVFGAGELDSIGRLGWELVSGKTRPDAAALAAFRKAYLDEIGALSGGKPYVTDKMPHNFRFIGLIAKAFPEAKIVHVQRDARAVCWSNFKQYFPANALGYCYDLSDVVAYYHLYQDLMAHWSQRYPGRVIGLDYEALTEDQDRVTRQLIADLGIDWEDACLSPHLNERGVKTASDQQVRKAVYRNSSAEWKKFEPYLGATFDAL